MTEPGQLTTHKCFTVVVLLITVCAVALGCGMTTHNVIAQRARQWYKDAHGVDGESMIARHLDALQGGAPYPDYLYQCGSNHSAGETTHWPPFQAAAAKYIHDKYPQPWDAATEKLVVFMLGVTSHYIADINWHGLAQVPFGQGFLRTLGSQDYNCSGSLCDTAHGKGDHGGEFVAAYTMPLGFYHPTEWYVPVQDLVEIYHYAPNFVNMTVNASAIEDCSLLFAAASLAVKDAGAADYPDQVKPAPFLAERYADYFLGGIDDMAVWTSFMWNRMMGWALHGPPSGHLPQADVTPAERSRIAPAPELMAFVRSFRPLLPRLRGALTSRATNRGITVTFNESAISPAARAAMAEIVMASVVARHTGADADSSADVSGRQEGLAPAARRASGNEFPAAPPSDMLRGTIDGFANNSYTGAGLCSGDLDGDGWPDLIVGSYGEGGSGLPQPGAVRIYYNISEPNAVHTAAAVSRLLESPVQAYARFGHACAVIDMNGDGQVDLVIGSPALGGGGEGDVVGNYTGGAYIFFGPLPPLPGASASLQPNVTLLGVGNYTSLGLHLHTVSDAACGASSQALPLLVFGAPYVGDQDQHIIHAGAVYILAPRPHWPRTLFLNATTADATVRLAGTPAFAWFGASIASRCINSTAVLAVGAPCFHTSNGSMGLVAAYSLHTSAATPTPAITTTLLMTRLGSEDRAKFGYAVALAGCGSTSGVCLAVGAPSYGRKLLDPVRENNYDMEGRVELLDWVAVLANPAPAVPWRLLHGPGDFAHLGWRFAVDEGSALRPPRLVVGAPMADVETGEVQIIPLDSPTSAVTTLRGSQPLSRFGLEVIVLAANSTLGASAQPCLAIASPVISLSNGERQGRVDLVQ